MSSTDTRSSTPKARFLAISAEWLSQLKALPTMTPGSHWMPYVCLFLYPILILQVKSGGSAMLALFLFSGVYMLIKEKANWDIKPILPLYYCFVFFWLVDFVTAGLAEREPVAGMLSSFTQIHFLAFPLFFVILCQLKYRFPVLLLGALVALLFAVGVSIYQLYTTRFGRAHGGINAILFANIVLLQMSFVAIYALKNSRLWLWIFVALGLVPIVLSLSRGTLLALLPLLITFLIYSKGIKGAWFKSRVFHCSLIIVIFVSFAFWDKLESRMERTYDDVVAYSNGSNQASSIGYRLLMYQGGMELFAKYPWLGVGRENTNIMLSETTVINSENRIVTELTHLHNEYLTTLVGSGLFGLLSLFFLLIAPYFIVASRTRELFLRRQVFSLCLLYSIYGLSNLAFDNGTLNGFFVLILAIVFSSLKNDKSHSSSILFGFSK
ncbi:O-antigen ligase family protein [bacterium SCSIO 12696]|uniref:O-antigen ligase family protein n=1 Tax=Porticoccus sp. W117 TaxID=3054777 RepID=UPI002209463C|nr:O-antigen ligase family protein [Porticoccus sp. W117]MDM3872390.1 O-antigen ligase family protein [Porticoccus sp. W117]UTW46035.1 O-antigen ligase family protein [bacterium SCSIO 12696]